MGKPGFVVRWPRIWILFVTRGPSSSRRTPESAASPAFCDTDDAHDAKGSSRDADRAASSYTKEFLFHQSNNERQLLQAVEGALARIRQGSFGECVNCGEEINAKRLEAVPWTRYCIDCQEKLEQGLLEETPWGQPGRGCTGCSHSAPPPTTPSPACATDTAPSVAHTAPACRWPSG